MAVDEGPAEGLVRRRRDRGSVLDRCCRHARHGASEALDGSECGSRSSGKLMNAKFCLGTAIDPPRVWRRAV